MKQVNQLFKKLFSKNEEDIGFNKEAVSKAEKRLGIKLPNSIREIYLHQVRNRLINSCHNFARPEHLFIEDSQWLIFYGENQGIWASAINLKDLKIYVNYEQQGYEKEAETIEDFLIVRAACDYGNYIYPHRMIAKNISKKDLEIVVNKLGKAKSEIAPPGYHFTRKLFWNNENEVIRTFEWEDGANFIGKKSIFIQSFDNNSFDKYYEMNKNIEWEILSQNQLKEKTDFTSYIEYRDDAYKIEIVSENENKEVSESENKEVGESEEVKDFDLPF